MLTNKEDIKLWLNKYQIQKYTIHENLTVDIDGDVNLNENQLTTIDLQFNIVTGNFDCSYNELTSLQGCPHTVQGYFKCYSNQLISLFGGPSIVNGSYHCYDNGIESLQYSPNEIGDDFVCMHNNLKTLTGGPKIVKGSIECNSNFLTSLKDCPHTVGEGINCADNPILQLDDFVCDFPGHFYHNGDPIADFEEFYIINCSDKIELNTTSAIINSVLLNKKLNQNIEQKNTVTKKLKI